MFKLLKSEYWMKPAPKRKYVMSGKYKTKCSCGFKAVNPRGLAIHKGRIGCGKPTGLVVEKV